LIWLLVDLSEEISGMSFFEVDISGAVSNEGAWRALLFGLVIDRFLEK